jgi:molybdate transport system ATP-binding protein
MHAGHPYLESCFDGISLERDGRRVLSQIHWRIRPGERWILAGANGSGKTQLLKVIAGIVRPAATARHALRWRLGGEWHDVPYGIREHIAYIGPERQDKYQRYEWNMAAEDVIGTGIYRTDIPLDTLTRSDRQRVRVVLERLGMAGLARRRFLELSYGERRMTLLARALIARPRLLLLDEIFAGLDEENRTRLMRWLARLRGALPLVMATHELDDIPSSATHALVLRRGRVVYGGRISGSPLARHLSRGAAGRTSLRKEPASGGRGKRAPAKILVSLRHASVYLDARCALRDVSLCIRAGEFWVIHGPNGAGKTTLLRTLYGDHGVAAGGSVQRAGIRRGIPLEFFRERTGIAGPYVHARYPRTATVAQVVQSGRHASIGLHRALTPADRAAAQTVLRRLNLARWARRTLGELSYGQTRLVLFARAIVCAPRLLLLDEPSDSLDAATREVLAAQILQLRARGVAIVVSAHLVREWSRYASHEIELVAGRVKYCGATRGPVAR